MIKRMVIMLLAVGVVFGGIFGFEAFRGVMIKKYMASLANQPQTVATAIAGWKTWQPRLAAVGTLRAVRGADLSLEVPGVVQSINFHSGEDVPAGAVLLRLRLDDDPAKLQALEATARLAAITYQRDSRQFDAQAISRATFDSDAANLASAQAQVAEQKAVLDKKVIRAPFAGHLGLRAVDLGQYLNAGTTVVTLQALDPLYVDFPVPQREVARLAVGQPVSLRVDAFPGRTIAGRITAIDPKVDPSSRNVQVRATVANPDHRLLPGMFAQVAIEAGETARHLTVPQTAITFNPYGSTVFLVEDKGKDAAGHPLLVAHQSFVTTGPSRGDQIAVLKGLKEGDTVVVAGQMKLKNGTPLMIDNSVRPTDDAHPQPIDQ